MFNFVFWYAWFKAMFTGTFIRLRNLIVRIFCKGRFALIQ